MKNRDQRRAYAMRRLSLAVDRTIRATQPADEERAMRWVEAWAVIAKLQPSAQRKKRT